MVGATREEARAEAAKVYKRAKKKRRKIKAAEKKWENNAWASSPTEAPTAPSATNWHRVGKDDGCRKAVDRPVDEAMINKLLEERTQAKVAKDYSSSDEITAKLVKMEIVYDDAKKEWHTRLLKGR